MKQKRGHRNNNPGNLRISSSRWKGKVPNKQNTDGAFEQFSSLEWGVRALIKLLRDSYIKRKGLNTVYDIINRYAPHVENPTTIYAEYVAKAMEVDIYDRIKPSKCNLKYMVQAIDKFENGKSIVTDAIFDKAWALSK